MSGHLSPTAISWLLGFAIAALLLWATVAIVRRPRDARRKPGGLQMLGAMMLGFGEPFDPRAQIRQQRGLRGRTEFANIGPGGKQPRIARQQHGPDGSGALGIA